MANLTEYLYSGPLSSASLKLGEETLDVLLYPGTPVKLPADHEFTRTLLAGQHLSPTAQPRASKQKENGERD